MTQRKEAEKVVRNLNADWSKIAHYIIERCGDFIFDHEREASLSFCALHTQPRNVTRRCLLRWSSCQNALETLNRVKFVRPRIAKPTQEFATTCVLPNG